MKQTKHLSRHWIKTGKVGAFASVAFAARQRQVRKFTVSTVLPCDDVFDMEAQVTLVLLTEATVLAAISCPVTNEVCNGGFHRQPSKIKRRSVGPEFDSPWLEESQ